MAMMPRRMSWGWAIAWTMVYALNLIVPLLLGWGMCGPRGRIGLGLAVVGYWGLGVLACGDRERWWLSLATGGTFVALTQFMGVLQVWAGMIAVRTWSAISGGEHAPLSGPGGFAVTGMTGGLLIAVAVICGSLLVALFWRTPEGKPKPVSYDEL